MEKILLSFGHGYSARALADRLLPKGWRIFGTTRKDSKINALRDEGIQPIRWPDGDFNEALAQATHILISAGPGPEGDPTLSVLHNEISTIAPRLEWAGYLSTTGVYGDHGGGWVDEATPLTPSTERGKARVAAERQWQSIPDLPLHIFRLAGIYGPGRGPFEKVKSGTARRIIKENQVFSRIQVKDIAQVLEASMTHPNPGAVYNVCDDDPAPPQDVIEHAANLLGLPVPPAVPFEAADMSPMARSFYAESKRVSNERIKRDLGINLLFPSYRDGLLALRD
ncbi:MAG: SDR family oxidoreductase [Sediminimonas qiaohouensis]|uniref:SDR family oxidoreductase n=1 Tax=Sediminimonas qiaohouensis TaxID=552061 RepID=A0A7C9HBM0_9RHOB|nr:SDR family oxidoreductase [Sediminimonas qiaohouensis]MTJ05386.1 SDR family oxidoreductase [Sediminimonas qiaohouensis]